MRGILDPNVRTEVDHGEATKYMSVVLILWISDNTSEKGAFIPTIKKIYIASNALRIISFSVEDSEVIIKEYVE